MRTFDPPKPLRIRYHYWKCAVWQQIILFAHRRFCGAMTRLLISIIEQTLHDQGLIPSVDRRTRKQVFYASRRAYFEMTRLPGANATIIPLDGPELKRIIAHAITTLFTISVQRGETPPGTPPTGVRPPTPTTPPSPSIH